MHELETNTLKRYRFTAEHYSGYKETFYIEAYTKDCAFTMARKQYPKCYVKLTDCTYI